MTQDSRKSISKQVERKLWAESGGRCMNPECQIDLFAGNGDIAERAHIFPYRESEDNSFENLVLLCPNCHTTFDKNGTFSIDDIRRWKSERAEQMNRVFGKKYNTFDELRRAAIPLLERNRSIYVNYYERNNKKLWLIFEKEILANNRKLSMMFQANLQLFQDNRTAEYSNRAAVRKFIDHAREFEATRGEAEKQRTILFPKTINSIFGILPTSESVYPSVESLELLIYALTEQGKFVDISIGAERPSFRMIEDGKNKIVYLDDTPHLRQLYNDYGCFRRADMRLDSLTFAMQYISERKLHAVPVAKTNLRKYVVNGRRIEFIYEYCLTRITLSMLAPAEETVIVNLHNWNGANCISEDARELAKRMNVTLLDMDEFYPFIRSL